MKIKKVLALVLAAAMMITMFAGCGQNSGEEENGGDNSDKAITVVSREDGSGTRGAFIELLGIETKEADGKS